MNISIFFLSLIFLDCGKMSSGIKMHNFFQKTGSRLFQKSFFNIPRSATMPKLSMLSKIAEPGEGSPVFKSQNGLEFFIERNKKEAIFPEKGTVAEYVLHLPNGDVLGTGSMVEDSSLTANAKVMVEFAIGPAYQDRGVENEILPQMLSDQLSAGSKFNSIFASPTSIQEQKLYEQHGFVPVSLESRILMVGNPKAAIAKFHSAEQSPNSPVLLNILGRLYHSVGELDSAVDSYTKALQLDPTSSEIFRNLGSAYHSQGSEQMAFASYQQAIQHNPQDWLTYFKLGLLYESLAVGKFEGAADHAIRCYDFFLNNTQSTDTDILTRMGNLQLKRTYLEDAIATYKKALLRDENLANVWANLATAQFKLGFKEDCIQSLQRSVELDPSLISSKHLIASLMNDDSVTTADSRYVSELFDFYADFYEDHLRKTLIYTAPRVLRQELRDMYNKSFLALPIEKQEQYGNDVLKKLNKSMNVLDLGCGTGLSGAWFIDYARALVGVDVSEKMVEKSTKKAIYKQVYHMDNVEYLKNVAEEQSYGLIIAADVFGYVGDLKPTFEGAYRALTPGGHFAFTIEKLSASSGKGFALQETGRFGYDKSYIENLAQLHGFTVTKLRDYSPLVERNEPVPGYLVILRKLGEEEVFSSVSSENVSKDTNGSSYLQTSAASWCKK